MLILLAAEKRAESITDPYKRSVRTALILDQRRRNDDVLRLG